MVTLEGRRHTSKCQIENFGVLGFAIGVHVEVHIGPRCDAWIHGRKPR